MIGGTIRGLVAAVANSSSTSDNVWLGLLESIFRFVAVLLGYAVAGLLLGAAVGGMIDYIWFSLLQ